jgi:hypothetical protein
MLSCGQDIAFELTTAMVICAGFIQDQASQNPCMDRGKDLRAPSFTENLLLLKKRGKPTLFLEATFSGSSGWSHRQTNLGRIFGHSSELTHTKNKTQSYNVRHCGTMESLEGKKWKLHRNTHTHNMREILKE